MDKYDSNYDLYLYANFHERKGNKETCNKPNMVP